VTGHARRPANAGLDLNRRLEEGAGVNTNTLCRALSASFLCVALAGCASKTNESGFKVVPLGSDTYAITCEAKNAFDRDVDRLKDDATAAANNYCASLGKEMRLVTLTSDLPFFSTGYARAKIVFKAVGPGTPQVAAEAAPSVAAAPAYAPAPAYVPAPAPAPAPAVAPKALSTDELYEKLVKLDDLRKKGILSDEEFQAEKRKLLNKTD